MRVRFEKELAWILAVCYLFVYWVVMRLQRLRPLALLADQDESLVALGATVHPADFSIWRNLVLPWRSE